MASEKTVDNCSVEFKFQCPKRWDALKETPEPNIRACDTCAKLVYFCASTEEAQAHAQVGHCVAIEAPAPAPAPAPRSSLRLGELLVRAKTITLDQLRKAREAQQKDGGRIGYHLIKSGAIEESKLTEFLSKQYDVPAANLAEFDIQPEVIKLLTRDICKKHMLVPVNLVRTSLIIAMSDPADLFAIDDIKFLTGYNIEPVVASEGAIAQAIERYYPDREVLMGLPAPEPEYDDEPETEASVLEEAARSGPVVRLIRKLLLQAIRKHATEVYIEPLEHGFRVMFKIEGIYQEEVRPPAVLKEPFIASLKIMAGLKVSERKKPQEGKLRLELGDGQAVEFVVRTAPTPRGEEARVTLAATPA